MARKSASVYSLNQTPTKKSVFSGDELLAVGLENRCAWNGVFVRFFNVHPIFTVLTLLYFDLLRTAAQPSNHASLHLAGLGSLSLAFTQPPVAPNVLYLNLIVFGFVHVQTAYIYVYETGSTRATSTTYLPTSRCLHTKRLLRARRCLDTVTSVTLFPHVPLIHAHKCTHAYKIQP